MFTGLTNIKCATFCAVIALAAGGCATTPIPNEKIAVAKSSVQSAEQSGAPELAPVEMAAARDKLARAEKAAADHDAQPATQLAEQAIADHDYGFAGLGVLERRPIGRTEARL